MKKMSKTTIKRKKKVPLNKLIKKLDAVFSVWIRTRDNYTCVLCGSKLNPCCGHLLKRGKHSTRFDEKNCSCLCRNCNFLDELDHDLYVSWFLEKYGEKEYLELVRKGHTIKKWSRDELEEMLLRYKIT